MMLPLAGCGSSRPATVPVKGKITLGGAPWPKAGAVYFLPVEPAQGFPRRPGEAAFEVDGRFVAGTFTKDDGLIPGAYQVRVECWEVPPTLGGPPPKSYLPQAYLRPQWTLKVEPGSKPLDLIYDVPPGK